MSNMALVTIPEADMRSALTRPACESVDPTENQPKRLATQHILARNTVDSDKASSDASDAEIRRLRVLGERAAERCDCLTAEVARNREAYMAELTSMNAKCEAARQQNVALQASLSQAVTHAVALEAENASLKASVALLSTTFTPPAEVAATALPTRNRRAAPKAPSRTYAAVAAPAIPAPGPSAPNPTPAPTRAQHATPASQPDELERLRNVIIFNVRACPLPRTADRTIQQVEAATSMPAGVRIRRLSRQREGDVEGPVMVTCRTPQQAFQLIRDLTTTETECGGLTARQDLSVEERAAKAARRCLNAEYVELVKEKGLRSQWRGPMRTELWVHTTVGNSMEWQQVLPGPPMRAPAESPTAVPQSQQLVVAH